MKTLGCCDIDLRVFKFTRKEVTFRSEYEGIGINICVLSA